MFTTRPSAFRLHSNHGWLDSWHTFSFGGHHDPAWMGWGRLRVINDDTVAPGGGFATHAHRDMEIISYVLSGALEHKDSLGTGSVIRPGDVQRMSAGTGVSHSEFNASKTDPVHFLQIWVVPDRSGLEPSYEQKAFDLDAGLQVVASREAGGVSVSQDIVLKAGRLVAGANATHRFAPGRRGWLHVARGRLTANGVSFGAGDGVGVEDLDELALTALEPSEVLVFDLK